MGLAIPATQPTLRRTRPWALALLSLAIALVLQAFIPGISESREIYLVLQLFILTQFVFNSHLQPWEYGLRWLILLGFWLAARPEMQWSWVALAVIGLGAYTLRHSFYTQWWPALVFAGIIGSLYWVTLAHLSDPHRLGYLGLYLLTMVASMIYTLRAHVAKRERAELLERLDHDTLTHAGNLNRLRRVGAQAFLQTQADQTPLAVTAIDIDHFKNYNDTYGHAASDQVLIAVVAKLYQQLPPLVSLYRTGGEELTVLMPNFDQAQALALTVKLWQAIRQMTVPYDQHKLSVSLSAGVTTRNDGDTSLDDLSRRADASLYLSKQRGRDCITVDGTTLDNGAVRTKLVSYTYFTQPFVDLKTQATWQGELMSQIFVENQWRPAAAMTIATLTDTDVLTQLLPISQLSVNLSFADVCDMHKAKQLCTWFNQFEAIPHFTIELTTFSDLHAFQQVLPMYRNAQIKFGLDVAGLPEGDAFIPYLGAFALIKAPLPQLRTRLNDASLMSTLRYWQGLAAANGCRFVLDHMRTNADVHLAENLGITIGEGYYFNKPILPRIV